MKCRTANYTVPALEKGLDILEALARADLPHSLTTLSRQLHRTPSELFRMLSVLEQRNFIARDPLSDRYSLTLKMFELAHVHSPVEHLLRAAARPMRDLADHIHESCHLSVLHGPMLLVIAQAESPEPVRLSVEVGYRVLPLTTASGCLLVAMLDDDARTRFLAEDATYAEMKPSARKSFASSVAQIRTSASCVAGSSRRAGIDISCLVGNPSFGVTAALGVPVIPGGSNDGKQDRLLAAIRKCADSITHAAGLSRSLPHPEPAS